MPTGYTAFIENGKITTGKEFLKLCTRAFGIANKFRDEPLSVPTRTRFEPDTYYLNKYSREVADLDNALALTISSARAEMRQKHERRIEWATEYVKKSTEINERYAQVRKQVEAWVPPTDAHAKLKEFALQQIDMCVVPDKDIEEYRQIANSTLDDSDKAVAEYIKVQIELCEKGVDRAKTQWYEEIKKANEKNEFMKQFLESLETLAD